MRAALCGVQSARHGGRSRQHGRRTLRGSTSRVSGAGQRDGVAEAIHSAEEKQRVWDVHRTTPPPIGFDPEPHYGSIHNEYYGLLRIIPSKITLANLGGEAMIWQKV